MLELFILTHMVHSVDIEGFELQEDRVDVRDSEVKHSILIKSTHTALLCRYLCVFVILIYQGWVNTLDREKHSDNVS